MSSFLVIIILNLLLAQLLNTIDALFITKGTLSPLG